METEKLEETEKVESVKGKKTTKKPKKIERKETEKVEVPDGFTRKTNLNKKEYGYYNGRKYLKLKNGYGMWADNGQGFLISDLK